MARRKRDHDGAGILSAHGRVAGRQLRAQWRGLELPDETARYMLTRVDRRARALFDLLDKLDRQALAAQKKLTVPFVKSVLDALSDDGSDAVPDDVSAPQADAAAAHGVEPGEKNQDGTHGE